MDAVPGIETERIERALQAILQSETFSRSERLRSFLKYIVDMERQGQAGRLKGYTIGIDVFGRDDSFDPTTDPLVRVQAGKLRRLLAQFYADEGQNEVLRIQVPVGAYVPVYEPAGTAGSTAAPAFGTASIGNDRQEQSQAADEQDLPTVFYRVAAGSNWRALAYSKAVSLWSNRLWGVQLKTLDEISADGRALDPIYFVLDIETHATSDHLTSTLRHVVSGDIVIAQQSTVEMSGDTLQIGSLANQFVGSSLTIPGHLYRYCHKRNLSSPLMLCLDATYRFTVEASQENYREAKLHQSRLGGTPKKPGLVLNIPEMVALARGSR